MEIWIWKKGLLFLNPALPLPLTAQCYQIMVAKAKDNGEMMELVIF